MMDIFLAAGKERATRLGIVADHDNIIEALALKLVYTL